MNYNNKDSGPNQSRSDIGQRVLWEPLTKEQVEILFTEPVLRSRILNTFTGSVGKVEWNDEHYGFFVSGNSSKMRVLVTLSKNKKELRDLFEVYNILSNQQYNEGEEALQAQHLIKLRDVFIKEFSTLVTIGTVITFSTVSEGSPSKFKEQHWADGQELPEYTFEGNVGGDSGSRAGVNIYSVPTTANVQLNANFPSTQTVDKREAKRKSQNGK